MTLSWFEPSTMLIMKLGPLPDAMDPADAMDPDIHGVRTHWIRGFMAF